jgi:hypothetical protein
VPQAEHLYLAARDGVDESIRRQDDFSIPQRPPFGDDPSYAWVFSKSFHGIRNGADQVLRGYRIFCS